VEAWYLFAASRDATERVRETLESVDTMRRRVRVAYGIELRSMRMLDVGPGQLLGHMRCFDAENAVVGVDMDVISEDLGVYDVIDMARKNSLSRVAKTVARKALGVDREFRTALERTLGIRSSNRLDVRRMDAAEMTFPGGIFDFVYACSVLEHVDRPRLALEQVRRVLAPGGVAYLSLHLYTSHSGHHDPRTLVETRPEPPYWPHLRAAHGPSVTPGAFVNRLRLADWRQLFDAIMPGVIYAYERQPELVRPLAELRARGELATYSDDELLTVNLVAMWRKPGTAARS
jgi:SAM-dependent methyltransferase